MLHSYLTFPNRQPFVDGKFASGLECRTSHSVRDFRPFSSTSLSLLFHTSRSSFDGAVPIIPGCVNPGKRTPDICIHCKAVTIYYIIIP